MKQGYIYILMSKTGILYVGVTSDLFRRVYEHKTGLNKGFSWKYNVHKLVYYEEFELVIDAIEREKQIKCWSRRKKLFLIEKENPEFKDIAKGWY